MTKRPRRQREEIPFSWHYYSYSINKTGELGFPNYYLQQIETCIEQQPQQKLSTLMKADENKHRNLICDPDSWDERDPYIY